MGWGVTRGRPPDKKQQEKAEKESRDKLVKTIKWKDQQNEKNLGVEPLLYNGDGEYRQTRGRQRGRDEQAEAGDDEGAMGRQDGTRQEEEANRARSGSRVTLVPGGPVKGPWHQPSTLVSGPVKGPRPGPVKGPWHRPSNTGRTTLVPGGPVKGPWHQPRKSVDAASTQKQGARTLEAPWRIAQAKRDVN